jgi:hypothetical protein
MLYAVLAVLHCAILISSCLIFQVASDPSTGTSPSGVEDVVWLLAPRTRKSDTDADAEGENEAETSPSIRLPEGEKFVSLSCVLNRCYVIKYVFTSSALVASVQPCSHGLM